MLTTSTIHTCIPFTRGVAIAAALLAASAAGVTARADGQSQHAAHGAGATPARFVQIVREATRQYTDINVATADGYGQFLGCISGPQEGAMGIHYVNGPRVADGLLDATKPEALIYEVTGTKARLVGVEFIVDAAAWLAGHAEPPVLEGQSFHYVGSPNRYGLPAFFELHVWAWRDNPQGTFADFNTRVSCEGL